MVAGRGKRSKPKPKAKKRRRDPKPRVEAVKTGELKEILERARANELSELDLERLEAAVDTLEFLFSELDQKTLTLARLRSLFGLKKSERTKDLLGAATPAGAGAGEGDAPQSSSAPAAAPTPTDAGATSQEESSPSPPSDDESDAKPAANGHGRNGVDDFPGANVVEVPHESLASGDPCPDCGKGKVYTRKQPKTLLRVVGQAPVQVTVVKLESLRCNLCGAIYTARAPDDVGEEKYDPTCGAMIGLLKYGSGLPFNRLERLQQSFGTPLPASTQWGVVRDAADDLEPVLEELIRQAAQGEVLQNDDTSATVLELTKENRELVASGEADAGARTGVFATGVVAKVGERRVALFFTGRKHAGENLQAVLRRRSDELGPPILMCDALDRNVPKESDVELGNCLSHGRRKFVDPLESFPDECRFVLETLREVFKHDAEARERHLSPEERLEHHQRHSGPLMRALERWLNRQLDDRLIEPNSSLGDAIRYLLNHWEPLTLFLRRAGAPLDNNMCERALKKFILHRKNAYFYKTLNGARVGDLFMSLIHTAELNQVNAFDYLVALLRHPDDVAKQPAVWLPWNYAERLAELAE